MARAIRLKVERLESRSLPAADATLAGGVLTVQGDGPDRINVYKDQSQLVVTDYGLELGSFASAAVSSIKVQGGNGGNIIRIAQSVLQPATIIGGVGQDDLEAGGGPAILDGTLGTKDKLVGGPAADTLLGGAGDDLLNAGGGSNDLDGGAGANKLVQVHPTDLITPNPGDTESLAFDPAADPADPASDPADTVTPLSATEVKQLLNRASAATPYQNEIVAIVDRNGRILGVRVGADVSPTILNNPALLTFAIDGAVAEARTGAFFASAGAPLTSRTIENLSQSTITQREVESNPSITDPNSTIAGPGFVAPVGVGGHFPPDIPNTPEVDLFDIEASNRDTTFIPSTGQDYVLGPDGTGRFGVNQALYVPAGQGIYAPVSYGVASGIEPKALARGIGTLPGGIPIERTDAAGGQAVVGGIGVFFPGTTGYATEENSSLSTTYDPSKPDLSLVAEYIAFAAVGEAPLLGFKAPTLGGVAPLPNIFLGLSPTNFGIDLAGITLDIVGPGGTQGPAKVVAFGQSLGQGTINGTNEKVDPGGDTAIAGLPVPVGWLVTPHDGDGVTAADVTNIIALGIAQANITRAAIRLPLSANAEMVFAVSDLQGNVVGLYRMPDATVFSIDVAVAKSRNTAYYADPSELQPEDNPGIPVGTAITNRTIRYLADPRYPEGIDGNPPGPYSILNDPGTNPITGLDVGPPLPASDFTSVMGHDAFNPETNFHDPDNIANQNGIVFFPGSAPIYQDSPDGTTGVLIGGFGVSGDGVNQDDVVTQAGQVNFGVPQSVLRADQTFVRGVRLPYQNNDRNPDI